MFAEEMMMHAIRRLPLSPIASYRLSLIGLAALSLRNTASDYRR